MHRVFHCEVDIDFTTATYEIRINPENLAHSLLCAVKLFWPAIMEYHINFAPHISSEAVLRHLFFLIVPNDFGTLCRKAYLPIKKHPVSMHSFCWVDIHCSSVTHQKFPAEKKRCHIAQITLSFTTPLQSMPVDSAGNGTARRNSINQALRRGS